MRGRKSKPKALNDLHGNPGRRKTKTQTLAAKEGKLGIPRGLHKNIQRKCAELARYIETAGAPIPILRPLFERYCRHLQFAYDAARVMKKGSTIDGKKKPEAQVWRDESAAASKIEGQIMNILKNTKAPKEKKSPLEKFQASGAKIQAVK